MNTLMKRFFKGLVVAILARQVRLLRKKHQFKIIGVVGGTGKTSTKFAIAQLLGQSLRVRYQEGNYNDIVSVPLVFFGQELPDITNPTAWIKLFLDNARQINEQYPYDVVVVELATDRIGHIAAFQKFIELDYAVVTAVVPEHMQYLHDMQSVADEELSVVKYAKKVLYNADLIAKKYRSPLASAISYAQHEPATFRLSYTQSPNGFACAIAHNDSVLLRFHHDVPSEIQLYSALAAVAVGNEMGLKQKQLLQGIDAITPVSGRLQRLHGIHGSVIIDDTYNALPDAVKPALAMLYGLHAPQKIAILGNMNQLGAMSAEAHTEIGELCDPAQLDLVVTVGPDANKYLAAAAERKGCRVQRFTTPYAAGEFVKSHIAPGAIILAKGSQDKVYVEEAIKPLLASVKDEHKLVRQSAHWLQRKETCFKEVTQ